MNWHRLFGLLLTDFFTGSPYKVEVEKDLSVQQQFLDVVVLRKEPGPFDGPLPDGFGDLADHNLISFKSHHEAFNAWTVKVLMGFYVSYRKLVNERSKQMLPESDFRFFGVCARFPTQLASQIELEQRSPGVFQFRWGTDVVPLVVVRDLPEEQQNAMLHLFSAVPEQVQFGRSHYKQKSPNTSTIIKQLLGSYLQEGLTMPYTMEDFRREVQQQALKDLTPEERLKGLPTEERLKGLPAEEILKMIPKEQIEEYLKKAEENK